MSRRDAGASSDDGKPDRGRTYRSPPVPASGNHASGRGRAWGSFTSRNAEIRSTLSSCMRMNDRAACRTSTWVSAAHDTAWLISSSRSPCLHTGLLHRVHDRFGTRPTIMTEFAQVALTRTPALVGGDVVQGHNRRRSDRPKRRTVALRASVSSDRSVERARGHICKEFSYVRPFRVLNYKMSICVHQQSFADKLMDAAVNSHQTNFFRGTNVASRDHP